MEKKQENIHFRVQLCKNCTNTNKSGVQIDRNLKNYFLPVIMDAKTNICKFCAVFPVQINTGWEQMNGAERGEDRFRHIG